MIRAEEEGKGGEGMTGKQMKEKDGRGKGRGGGQENEKK